MKLFKTLPSLPPVPLEFVHESLSVDRDIKTDISGYDRMMPGYRDRILVKGVQTYRSARSRRCSITPAFEQWIRHNVTEQFNASVSVTAATSPSWGPHADITSKFNLIYVFSTGGHACATYWWQEQSRALDHIPMPGSYVNNYDLLTELTHVQMKPATWYWIDQRYLHSVENLESERVALHVRLPDVNTWNQHGD